MLRLIMQYKLNHLLQDEFGRYSGVLAINKPQGWTSHDVVAKVRGILSTRKVGHAGALDPFASGLLIILVGKATQLSDTYMNSQKEYVANVLFGIQSDSGDPEGNLLAVAPTQIPPNIEEILQSFVPQYKQTVPVFSSIKVDGEKLRIMARKCDRLEKIVRGDKDIAIFHKGNSLREVILPKHICQIPRIELISVKDIDITNSAFWDKHKDNIGKSSTFKAAVIKVECSKGTYIRALAEDIGRAASVSMPAMLWDLQRTRVGEARLEDAIMLEDILSRAI